MRKLLDDVKALDEYLQRRMEPGDRAVLDARFIVQPDLKLDLQAQKKTLQLVNIYGRNLRKQQLESIHQKLIRESNGFKALIHSIFK